MLTCPARRVFATPRPRLDCSHALGTKSASLSYIIRRKSKGETLIYIERDGR